LSPWERYEAAVLQGLVHDSLLVSILIDLGVYKSRAELYGQTASALEYKKKPAGLGN